MKNFIEDIDSRFFHFLRRCPVSPGTGKFLRFYTRLGDGYVWALVIAYIYFFLGQAELIRMIWLAVPSVLASLALYWLLKLSIRRRRPFDALQGVSADVPPLDKFSFPSGHTMNNLAVGFTILAEIPQIGWVVVLMPITWGFLRVYYGVHWLSDVIGGLLLGFASFWIGSAAAGVFNI